MRKHYFFFPKIAGSGDWRAATDPGPADAHRPLPARRRP